MEEEEYGSKTVPEDKKEDQENEVGDKNCYRQDPISGKTVYTDPVSKTEYVLNDQGTDWVPAKQDYQFDGQTYLYTDKQGVNFKWDLLKKEWVKMEQNDEQNDEQKKEDEEESEEDDDTTDEQRKERMFRKRKAQPGWGSREGRHWKDEKTGVQLYSSGDGMVYEWDVSKNAWFPRIDEDFMANYQMNYGFTPDGQAQPTKPSEQDEAKPPAVDEKKKENVSGGKPQWFQADSGSKVYVLGLPDGKPDDWDDQAFATFMSKCGVVDVDPRTNTAKVKLYKDQDGQYKGDGLCTYAKVESVELAMTIIDGSEIVPGKLVVVERAKFEMKGEAYDPKLKPKKLAKKELERAKKKREKMLAWEPDKLRGERSKRDKVIVVENVFDVEEFNRDASLILDCSTKLREHCSRLGNVRKVVVYDKHVDGICQVFFASPEEADIAISMLDGRLFGSRPMKAYTWDGKTKYKVSETEEEEKERLANWDQFLASCEQKEEEEADQK